MDGGDGFDRLLSEYAGARATRGEPTPTPEAPTQGVPDMVRDSTPRELAGAAPPSPEAGSLWAHAGGDLYRVLGPGRAELPGGCWQDGVAYAAANGGGTIYVRSLSRFHARFKEVRGS